MRKRFEQRLADLIDLIDRIFGLEWLARRADFSPAEAKRIARER